MTLRLAASPDRRVFRFDLVSFASLLIVTATLGVVLTVASLSPLKDDVAWLLYVARKWLGGQRLYEDLVEVNPPLIIWLYALPAWAAQALGIAPKLAANPFFAAILLGCAWWTAEILHGRAPLLARRLPVFSLIGTLLLILPGVEFGQREHLLAACVLPYLALFVRALEGEKEPRFEAAAAGAIAGLACALKPSYALALLLVEVMGAVRGHRMIRIAPVAAAVATGIYGLAVLVFCPAFLDKGVPLALALYGGTDTPYLTIMWESRVLLFGQVAVLLLCWTSAGAFAERSPFLRHLLLTLAAFSLGATVVFVLQGKDWFYHRLPATTTTILALALWFLVMAPAYAARLGASMFRWRDWPADIRRAAFPAAVGLLSLGMFGMANAGRIAPWVTTAVEPTQSTEVKLQRLIKREKAKTYIAFSEWIALGFPVVDEAGVTWASRFDSMWALKGEIWRARQDGSAPREWPIRTWVAKDFIANCPDIAVVDTREGINYVGVLIASNAEFARAWSQYRQIASFDGLRVLKRSEAGCQPNPQSPAMVATGPAAPRALALEQP